jgi:hypothetical protein
MGSYVGHTGINNAQVKSLHTVNYCLGNFPAELYERKWCTHLLRWTTFSKCLHHVTTKPLASCCAFGSHKSGGFLEFLAKIIVWRKTDFWGIVIIGCFSEIHVHWTLLLWQSFAIYFKWYFLFNSDDVISTSCDCYVQSHQCSRSLQCWLIFSNLVLFK